MAQRRWRCLMCNHPDGYEFIAEEPVNAFQKIKDQFGSFRHAVLARPAECPSCHDGHVVPLVDVHWLQPNPAGGPFRDQVGRPHVCCCQPNLKGASGEDFHATFHVLAVTCPNCLATKEYQTCYAVFKEACPKAAQAHEAKQTLDLTLSALQMPTLNAPVAAAEGRAIMPSTVEQAAIAAEQPSASAVSIPPATAAVGTTSMAKPPSHATETAEQTATTTEIKE